MATITTVPAKSRRTTELFLLLLAVGIGVAAYCLVGLGASDTLPPDIAVYGGGMLVLTLGVHVALRATARFADPVLLPAVTALNGIGIAMIYRIDLALHRTGWTAHDGTAASSANRQLMWSALGILACIAVVLFVRDHRVLRRYTFIFGLAGLALLVLPILPVLGTTINGSRVWIHLGPLSFQPGEIAKICLTVFFAGYLVSNRDSLALAGPKVLGLQLPRVRDLGPILIAWAASVGVLVLQRDLGSALLFFGLFVGMLYIATERVSWTIIGLLMFSAGAWFAAQVFGHVHDRVQAWLHPLSRAVYDQEFGGSYQLVQGLFGMAHGGLFGTGLGQGRPQIVPFADSDFIIASLGEELGMVGLFALLMLYLVVVERGFRTALASRDGFGKLLAGGLAFSVTLQLFVVIGGVTRLIPLTGLTTPFLAAGGSSLLANWIIVGLLLRISDGARRPPAEPRPAATAPGEAVSAS